MADEIPQNINPAPQEVAVISPEGEVGTIHPSELESSLQSGYLQATPQDIAEAKYGGLGQQAIAGGEAAAQGATFGLSTGIETALGVSPEDIRGRAEANPITHGVGQVAGLAASTLLPGAGEAGLLRAAGEGGAEALGLGVKGAGFVNQVGGDAVKAAFEATLFQGGEEISNAFAQDPNQTAETAIADLGLSAVMGGVFGGAIGAGLRGANKALGHFLPEATTPAFVSELDKPALDAGDFKASIENSNILGPSQKQSILEGLGSKKADAAEIEAAAKRLNAPVLEGMTSDSKVVQKAEDMLLNGAPTYSGLARQALYGEGYKAVNTAVNEALGEGSQLTKAELGNALQDSIASQIKQQNAPIADMYNEIKKYHKFIPLDESLVPKISADLEQMPELRVAPSSPGAKLAKDVFNEVGNLKTVDDIKAYRSSLYDRLPPTASQSEKRVAAIINDKLKNLEEDSIEQFAKGMPKNDEAKAAISSLIDQRKLADAQYKPFIEKVKTLSEQLGKGRIHGAQDAIHFLQNLTPEQVTQRLFSKNNSEFLKFFGKEFPDQMEMMRAYQKGILRDSAQHQGEFSAKTLFNKINKLEPEIQQSIFNKAELAKIKDAETYLSSFPKNFNPSGSSGATAFRAFFEHPTGAVVGNIRDFAIEKFIKAVSASPEIKNASQLAKATVSGWNTTKRAVKAVMNPDKAIMPASVAASMAAREKLKKIVDDYNKNPAKMFDMNNNNPIPAYNQAFSSASVRAVQYLATQKPNTGTQNPLDTKRDPSPIEQAKYNRALDIAQQPLLILKHIHDGTLMPQDLISLKTIYPSLYNQMAAHMQREIVNVVDQGKTIPYQKRLGLSLFLGQTLDSTMLPQSIISAQPMPSTAPNAANSQDINKPKRGTASLSKVSNQFQTKEQAAEADQLKR